MKIKFFYLSATLLLFISITVKAQTAPTCPGTGYCETNLHSQFADLTGSIGSVRFAGINNFQTASRNAIPPTDSHCEPGSATVKNGETYDITIKGDTSDAGSSSGESNYYGVWIDYNHDGTFSEDEFATSNQDNDMLVYKGTITIPQTALTGKTRMRIRADYSSDPPFAANESCTNRFYGETEDYEVNIVSCPAYAEIRNNQKIPFMTDSTICKGDSVLLDAYLFGSGVHYSWNTGDTTASIVAYTEMSYAVVVTNSNGCKAIDSVFIHVTECNTNGIKNYSAKHLSIAPNPSLGKFSISFYQASSSCKFEIYDLSGKQVFSKSFDKQLGSTVEEVLDLEYLTTGLYTCKLISDRKIFVEKLSVVK